MGSVWGFFRSRLWWSWTEISFKSALRFGAGGGQKPTKLVFICFSWIMGWANSKLERQLAATDGHFYGLENVRCIVCSLQSVQEGWLFSFFAITSLATHATATQCCSHLTFASPFAIMFSDTGSSACKERDKAFRKKKPCLGKNPPRPPNKWSKSWWVLLAWPSSALFGFSVALGKCTTTSFSRKKELAPTHQGPF